MSQVTGAIKRGSELREGDVIGSRGSSRTITRIEPYPNPHLIDCMDERWRIAYSGDWGETIDPDSPWRQAENGVWGNAFHVNPDGTWVA